MYGMDRKSLALPFFGDDLKASLSGRLKRIEGQVRGIDRMLQENQPCPQVLNQLSATAAALSGVSLLVLRNYLDCCVTQAIASGDPKRKEAVLNELMDVLKRFGQ
jgi:CsoR family transcriptional regulator, copper-sensing transcriptional repressor